jgi:hypothetical protein
MKEELIKYARGLGARENVIDLIESIYDNQDQGEFEHIIDYLIHKDFDNLSWASYNLLSKKSKKWVRMLNQNVATIDEEHGVDIETILDFQDGYRFVKLLSKNAYTREGNLMSHCVSDYYNRDVEIYSLRDSFNKPHCTIEKDRQIKGKGNGSISPKYIDYVVKFLEWTGMAVRDNEMSNLGYRVAKFPKYIENKLYRGKYIKKDEQETYKEGVSVFKDLERACSYTGEDVVLFDGSANFRKSSITSLGRLQSIGGYADFGDSSITSLGQLQSIGGSVNFRGSSITRHV